MNDQPWYENTLDIVSFVQATTKREGSIEIFCSYAHKDEALYEEFAAHAAEMKRRWVQLWYDRLILPGAEWKKEIDDRLNRADIVLLFVTSDFMSSGYCYGVELNQAMIRQARKEAIIVPIIVRSCDWKDAAFAQFQELPSGGKPVTKWADRDEAWTDVVLKLKMTVKDRLERARERLNNAFEGAANLPDPGAKGDWHNAMTLQTPEMAEKQRVQMERWKSLQETQRKILEIRQQVTLATSSRNDERFKKWDEYVRQA